VADEDIMWFDAYITRTPGVQGGEPVLAGTRTPVRTVAVLFHVTYPGDQERVARALPHLRAAQIDAALAYYDCHRNEIDQLIEENRKAFEAFSVTQ
jgi:uncharacterized protein (DUF433 family)